MSHFTSFVVYGVKCVTVLHHALGQTQSSPSGERTKGQVQLPPPIHSCLLCKTDSMPGTNIHVWHATGYDLVCHQFVRQDNVSVFTQGFRECRDKAMYAEVDQFNCCSWSEVISHWSRIFRLIELLFTLGEKNIMHHHNSLHSKSTISLFFFNSLSLLWHPMKLTQLANIVYNYC